MNDGLQACRPWAVWLIGWMALVGGCAGKGAPPAPSVASDLTKPRAAAQTFYRAIAAGDRTTAHAASIGEEAHRQWVDAVIAMLDGLRAFDQALVARYGAEATQAHAGLRRAIEEMADGPVIRMQDAIVRESEEDAIAYPATSGIRLSSRSPTYLRRVKQQWKVDLDAMAGEPAHDPATVAAYHQAAQMLQRGAREVRAGRYATLADAERSLAARAPAAGG